VGTASSAASMMSVSAERTVASSSLSDRRLLVEQARRARSTKSIIDTHGVIGDTVNVASADPADVCPNDQAARRRRRAGSTNDRRERQRLPRRARRMRLGHEPTGLRGERSPRTKLETVAHIVLATRSRACLGGWWQRRRQSNSVATQSPSVGRSSPAAHCSSVLLPDPDGTITAVKIPDGTPTVTPSSATTELSLVRRPCGPTRA
jgi:hypothetical protein